MLDVELLDIPFENIPTGFRETESRFNLPPLTRCLRINTPFYAETNEPN